MEKRTIERRQLFREINSLLVQYCDGCFLQKQNLADSGRRKSHKFCISQCTVGEQLKSLGDQLSGK
ncbi:zinc-finger domain-containing protein [Bacillus sp. EB01]|uniref:zinc-finger domain-containing protein n=1 Tax=Bacillus sp. EB01 TaxID=1347086 RepID=UPI000B19C899